MRRAVEARLGLADGGLRRDGALLAEGGLVFKAEVHRFMVFGGRRVDVEMGRVFGGICFYIASLCIFKARSRDQRRTRDVSCSTCV